MPVEPAWSRQVAQHRLAIKHPCLLSLTFFPINEKRPRNKSTAPPGKPHRAGCCHAALICPRTWSGSTFTPGPMVLDNDMARR